MSGYVLDYHHEGERERLALMSRLLDLMHRRHLEQLGIGPGARTLEVGCGNGSMSAWLAGRVAPGGHAVAVDLDLSLADADVPGNSGESAASWSSGGRSQAAWGPISTMNSASRDTGAPAAPLN